MKQGCNHSDCKKYFEKIEYPDVLMDEYVSEGLDFPPYDVFLFRDSRKFRNKNILMED